MSNKYEGPLTSVSDIKLLVVQAVKERTADLEKERDSYRAALFSIWEILKSADVEPNFRLSEKIWAVVTEALNPTSGKAKDALRMPKCGHPISLLVKSVESDYEFCDYCEVRNRLADAEKMEVSYKFALEKAKNQIMDLRLKLSKANDPTWGGE